ncbi:MAG TPA: DUF2703 domain-containing protein [Terriglobales bacterium]|nr:DUF2703 domain-containing protein [Terriglobales bacterium]
MSPKHENACGYRTCGEAKSPCCEADKEESCRNEGKKKALVEYLYLDLSTCDRCIGADAVLDDVMADLTPALRLSGYETEVRKIEIASEELAKAHRFYASPTIRVNGRDICPALRENRCRCCGELSRTDIDCRVFEYEGSLYEVPPKEMLAQAVLETLFGQPAGGERGSYEMPDNLAAFFAGKRKKAAAVKAAAKEGKL